MNRKMAVLRNVFLLFSFTLLLSFNSYAEAMITQDTGENAVVSAGQQYAPDHLIVKFREGVDPQAAMQRIMPGTGDIQRLYPIKFVAAKFRKDYKLEKTGDGWYSFLGKTYKEISEIPDEEIFREAYNAMPEYEKGLYRTYTVKVPERTGIKESIRKLEHNNLVEYAEPDYIAKVQMVPNDQFYNTRPDARGEYSWYQPYADLWGLRKIGCEKAWDLSQGEGVVVAVIDTGVDYNHPDLWDNIWVNPNKVSDRSGDGKINLNDCDLNGNLQIEPNEIVEDMIGKNFSMFKVTDDPMDGHGHGTHCAGTIAAVGNNQIGVIGVAPKAKIMVLKGLNDSGMGLFRELAKCVVYAADNGAQILSNSWGGYLEDNKECRMVTEAFNYAYNKGCVIIAAAGNDNKDISNFLPAGLHNVITVSAINRNDEQSRWSLSKASNFGENVLVTAPGGGDFALAVSRDYGLVYDILSTMNNDTFLGSQRPTLKVADSYWRLAGTSMACPHVSGVAALILSRKPTMKNDEVREMLIASSDDIGNPGRDINFGYGRVNAFMAVNLKANLHSSSGNKYFHDAAKIYGIAGMETPQAFEKYELCYAPKDNPSAVVTLARSWNMASNDAELGVWDTRGLAEGSRHLLILKITDKQNFEHVFTKEVIVDNIEESPVFAPVGNKGALIGKDIKFSVEADDPDDPARSCGQLIYSAYNLPPGATFNAEKHEFSWRPVESDLGSHKVTFSVRDNITPITRDVTITVTNVEETEIADAGTMYFGGNIDVSANRIGWIESELTSNPAAYIYDIVSGIKSYLDINFSGYLYKISMCKDKVITSGDIYIYEDEEMITRNGINLYDFSKPANQKSLITMVDAYIYYPRIRENRIVWMEELSDGASVKQYLCIYNLSDGSKVKLSMADEIYMLDFYGDKVVWRAKDATSKKRYVAAYDILSGQTTRITGNDADVCAGPSIYGDKIVWGESGNVYKFDFVKNQKECIATGRNIVYETTVHKDKVVWNTNEGLFYYDPIHGMTKLTDQYNGFIYSFAIYEEKIVYFKEWDRVKVIMTQIFFAPTISSINPATVKPGQDITITGADFGTAQVDSCVEFANGVKAVIKSWSADKIVCTVTGSARSGLITVTAATGKSNGMPITVAAVPQIMAVSPNNAIPGANIYVYGKNFGVKGNLSSVRFSGPGGSANAQIMAWSDTVIVCRVPSLNVGFYDIIVVNEGNSDPLKNFAVRPPSIAINSLSPAFGRAGTYLTIYGRDFLTLDTKAKVVFYNDSKTFSMSVSILDITNDMILCKVPLIKSGAYNVKIWYSNYTKSTNSKSFKII